MYLSTEDVLTDETARQVLVLNETWERVCSDGTNQVQNQVQTKSEPRVNPLNLEAAVLGVLGVCSSAGGRRSFLV